jgi:hypothetical protein
MAIRLWNRLPRLLVLPALLLTGCCSWCDRNCPQRQVVVAPGYAPQQCCNPTPAYCVPTAAQSGYAVQPTARGAVPEPSFNNPTGCAPCGN